MKSVKFGIHFLKLIYESIDKRPMFEATAFYQIFSHYYEPNKKISINL